MKLSVAWKGVLCTLFLFLASCSSKCQNWEVEEISSYYPCYSTVKISLSPIDECFGIELQIVRSRCDTRMYASIFGAPVYPSGCDESKVNMVVTIDDRSYPVLADRFRGGQKFLVPEEISAEIVTALTNGVAVTISVGRYTSEIVPNNFLKCYKALN